MAKRILMADDSPVIQSLSKKIFQNQGYEFKGTKTGMNVLDVIRENFFDILILDIILPDANGMEIARQIRQLEDQTKASIPIIAVSGNYKNYTADDFQQAGITEFLIKPLNYDQLVNTVKKYTQDGH
jgi:CheY-like chemotaxis protein